MLEIIKEYEGYCGACQDWTVDVLLWSDDTDGEEQQYFTQECSGCGQKKTVDNPEKVLNLK